MKFPGGSGLDKPQILGGKIGARWTGGKNTEVGDASLKMEKLSS